MAQIVITAATPMMEEPEQPFPPAEEAQPVMNHQNDIIEEETEDDIAAEESDEMMGSRNDETRQKDCNRRLSDGSEDEKCKGSRGKQCEGNTGCKREESEPIIEEPDDIVKKGEIITNRACDIEVDEIEEPEPAGDTGSGQFVVSSSTGSDGDTTGPSTAENSISHAPPPIDPDEPKQVVGGRASIPDELEPHQLARLQDLKESNA